MERIFIVGAGGHAKVIADIIEAENRFKITCFIDKLKCDMGNIFGYSICDETVLCNDMGTEFVVIAIGDNFLRNKVKDDIIQIRGNIKFATLIHPTATIGKGVKIGEGSVIMPHSSVGVSTKIGDHCIINTNSSVDHDCVLSDYSTVAPGAVLGGNVVVGQYSAIGIGACISHNVEIGEHSIIGAGSSVIRDVPDYVVAYGSPCKVARVRTMGEKYL